ncbi:nucleotide-binding universal stress UspA family protein [Halopolyspora algeriensis]|uniref:Nucleotide-binding universal stress UspA family protein n=1 Tax=Halopolyspora algeriensis TaxID=1500506 RepID=A0A368VQJ8_9ACTN|nr:universal stress protein [Halopolyspora algeriensis]RCW43930.1 nucleotide-binding universal stress UspA family protein [Halopolyspora algeriensis]TQM53567.1 nucleotide-binding universal stress UspA family protein [Halopolyspora algeriensis]
MSSYRTVVVGTDGSSPSMRAVVRAAEVARDSSAELVIVCAYYPSSDREVERAQDELGDEAFQVVGAAPAEQTLREAGEHARAAGADSIKTVPVLGPPINSLIEAADEHAADLLVVGSRGLNTLKGRIIGSVPSEVSRRSDSDVLVVRTAR